MAAQTTPDEVIKERIRRQEASPSTAAMLNSHPVKSLQAWQPALVRDKFCRITVINGKSEATSANKMPANAGVNTGVRLKGQSGWAFSAIEREVCVAISPSMPLRYLYPQAKVAHSRTRDKRSPP